jgi:hypothetical protein
MTNPLVTDEMRATEGVWGEETVSFAVDVSDIRRWAQAVYWPEEPPRLYWDAEYAKTTHWGGIVAPEEFNPFAWPIGDWTDKPGWGIPPSLTPSGGSRGMNGGVESQYFARIRPGDVIRERSRLSHWKETTTRLGPTVFIYHETEWRNQRDELVMRRMGRVLRF